MSVLARAGGAGRTRVCPHCKSVVLESLNVCPSCRHHLRFGVEAERRAQEVIRALAIEGQVSHPPGEEPCEYSIVVTVCDTKGAEIARKLVAVGSLQGGERCTVSLEVEVLPPLAPAVEESAPLPAVTERPEAPVAASGRRLPDGTILQPPGLGPHR
jgi:hypothetical protein